MTVADLARWKVHGPVKTLKMESATWDLLNEEWQPGRHWTEASFRPDGKIATRDSHNPDGSVQHSRWLYDDAGKLAAHEYWTNDGPVSRSPHIPETYTFDPAGRKIIDRNLPPGITGYAIDGSECSYGAPGATTSTTVYDENDLPAEVLFHGRQRDLIRKITLTRDAAGRILIEEMHLSEANPFADVPGIDQPHLAAIQEIFRSSFSRTAYAYDSDGRLTGRIHRMGTLSEDRCTWRYEDHPEPVEQTSETKTRDAGPGDNGIVHYSEARATFHQNRFDYQYDAHGNWTEKIVSGRPDPNASYQRSNSERRTITYYSANEPVPQTHADQYE